MNGVPITPIGGGLNESRTPGEQPAGTYREGVNVRGIDPRTGRRVWGAQRAGLEKLGPDLPGGAHARHFAVASKLIAAREFRSLGLEPLEGADPAVLTREWEERLDERVLDVALGVDGQGYYLLQSGDVVILNSKGKEAGRIYSAVPNRFVAVPRVFVSADGAVFTAATRDEPIDDVAGYVYRWVKQEDQTYTKAYEAPIKTRIATFVEGNGVLYVAEDGPADSEGEFPAPALTRIGAPSLGPEIAWRETVFPRPCFDLTLNDNGQVFASCPSNPDRAGTSALFTERNVGWTPYELFNFDIGNLWAWVDGASPNEEGDSPLAGEAVTRLRDRRFDDNPFAELDEDIPERELLSSPSGLFPAPTWDEDAFGGVGAPRFSGSSSLVSQPHANLSDPAVQQALIPSNLTEWTVFALVEFTEDQAIETAVRQLLAQRTDLTPQPDWAMTVIGLTSRFNDLGVTTSQPLTTTAAPRTALITLQHGGEANAISCRVNGANVLGNVVFNEITQGGPYSAVGSSVEIPGPFTVIGAGRPNRANVAAADDVTISSEVANTVPFGLLVNGERKSSEGSQSIIFGALFQNQTVGTKLRIDLGEPRSVDSLALWSSDTRRSARTARVAYGNDGTFASFENEQIIDVVRGSGDNNATRTEIAFENPSNLSFQYIEIEAATFFDLELWQLTEVEVFAQDARDASQSAEFNFAEMISVRGIALNQGTFELPSWTEQVEGYMAHRWGVSHTLDAAHPFFGPGKFPPGLGEGAQDQDAAILRGQLNSPLPILAKYGTNGEPLAVFTGSGVGCGAAYADGKVFAIGETRQGFESLTDPELFNATFTRFKDEQRALVREDSIPSIELDPASPKVPFEVDREPVALEAGPCSSIFAATDEGIRRIDGLTIVEDWRLPSDGIAQPLRALPAGLQFDATLQGGDCGPEFLYVAQSGLKGASRVTTLGLTDTGREKGRDTELLVVSSAGDVLRPVDGDWETVEAGALRGRRPASATLFGKTVFADGLRYRVYDHQLKQLRDFEEAVSGNFPARCELIAAYRGRLVLAGGDNAFTVYQSRFGDVFDFNYGNEVQSISQAIAGTVNSQGLTPEPITALMPWRDDMLYLGTTESLFVIIGDLADGGRLDHIDKSQGVAPGYAWCESPRGIYYFSGRGGVMLIGSRGLQTVSGDSIERRLKEVDLSAQRVELQYNWIDKAVHVYVIPNDLQGGIKHYTFEESTGAWHLDGFGSAFEMAVTGAESLIGDKPEDRSLLLGLADGGVYRWDQYARDDAGRPVESYAVIGPMLPESSGVEAHIGGVYGQLASDQSPLDVAVRGSNSPDAPGPPGDFKRLLPGRGLGVGFNVTAPSVFLEVRGTGTAWAAHQLRAEIAQRGRSRRVNG